MDSCNGGNGVFVFMGLMVGKVVLMVVKKISAKF